MASAGSLTIDLNANTARLRSDFTKATAMTRQYKRQSISAFKKVRGAVLSLKGAVFALAGVAGVGALAKSFVGAASTSEQYATRLKILLGSVNEGNRLFKEMTAYASKVPFEYENIMNSATQLAGVMKGGVDEINQWMPLIGDLAATSGLTIEETTEQVVRMYSAGAASADKFRERGILAMLGFKAGVSVSAEETREKLMSEWKKQGSQFRGATGELAQTWGGMMSMLSDKWFQFRVQIMKGGLFNWLKGLVKVIDGQLGDAIDGSSKKAKQWSSSIVDALEGVLKGFAFLSDFITTIRVIIKGVEVGIWSLGYAINALLDKAITPMIQGWVLISRLMGASIPDFTMLSSGAEKSAIGLQKASKELGVLVSKVTAGRDVTDFLAKVREEGEGIAGALSNNNRQGGDSNIIGNENSAHVLEYEAALEQKDRLDALHKEQLAAKLAREKENAALWQQMWMGTLDTFSRGVGDAFADAIIEQKGMTEALAALGKQVVKQVISGLIQIAIKRAVLNKVGLGEQQVIVASGVKSAGALATAYAPAAAAASLASFGANAVPAQTGIVSTYGLTQSLSAIGQAHDGMDYVPKTGTYFLEQGEFVAKKGNAEGIRDLANGSRGGDVIMNNTFVQTDGEDPREFGERVVGVMKRYFHENMISI